MTADLTSLNETKCEKLSINNNSQLIWYSATVNWFKEQRFCEWLF